MLQTLDIAVGIIVLILLFIILSFRFLPEMWEYINKVWYKLTGKCFHNKFDYMITGKSTDALYTILLKCVDCGLIIEYNVPAECLPPAEHKPKGWILTHPTEDDWAPLSYSDLSTIIDYDINHNYK